MRIAIVNDVPLVSEGLRRILAQEESFSLAWMAENGQVAYEKALQDKPDLILMDLMMPVLDGVEATRRIMQDAPCPILVVTASVDEHIAAVFQAMSYGALDAISTPVVTTGNPEFGSEELVRKIIQVDKASKLSAIQLAAQSVRKKDIDSDRRIATGLVVIGASSGGPAAIEKVLKNIPCNIPAAVVVVQHVDEKFAPRFVDWLNGRIDLPVKQAEEGDRLIAGQVYVAVTRDHLVLDEHQRLNYTRIPEKIPYRPSVDVFFNSMVDHWRMPACGVLLTGMGNDGATGLRNMRENGFYTIAQDEKSSAVYGMPRAARELHAAIDVLGDDHIGEAIRIYCDSRMR